jgi:hypothetical protein
VETVTVDVEASASASASAAALTTVATMFHDCGVAVLRNATAGVAGLVQLRAELIHKLELSNGADVSATGKAAKYLLDGVRGNARAEFVLPATPSLTELVQTQVLTPAVTGVLEALLGHPPAVEFASVMA